MLEETPTDQNAQANAKPPRLALFLLQLNYAYSLYSSDPATVTAAANIGSHHIASPERLVALLFELRASEIQRL